MKNSFIKVIKDSSFILYGSLSVFLITIINKIILFVYYDLPTELIQISIEDLYLTGIIVATIIILMFFFFYGLVLVLEMLIVTFLPKKIHKKAYETIVLLYILYPFCIYLGLIEFIQTGHIDKTKSMTAFISIVFGISLAAGILLKIILVIFKNKKK